MSFPNFHNKHDNTSLLEPCDFVQYLKSVGKSPVRRNISGAVFCYDRRLMQYICENHKVETEETFFGKILYLQETPDEIAVIGNFGIGAPAAVAALEILVALGTKKFISIGTAGTLQEKIGIGDLVVCEKAIRDEGASHHYVPASKYAYPSEAATKRLVGILNRLKHPFHFGTSWTVDAPYRETKEEVKHYQLEGVATVEMEAAALFAVASYRKVEMGSILTISDSLAELRWLPQFYHERTKAGLETLYQVSLEYMKE